MYEMLATTPVEKLTRRRKFFHTFCISFKPIPPPLIQIVVWLLMMALLQRKTNLPGDMTFSLQSKITILVII
jgi:hypothetical protein